MKLKAFQHASINFAPNGKLREVVLMDEISRNTVGNQVMEGRENSSVPALQGNFCPASLQQMEQKDPV